MSLDITIQLDDQDLDHFIEAMRRAQVKAAGLSPKAIVDAASKLLVGVPTDKVPHFIKDRLEKLDQMIQLVLDEGYGLPDEDRNRVLSCLAYFADPDDIIPDNVPVIGFLDDAIMIELCVRELRPEIDSYSDFVLYRNQEATRRGVDPIGLRTQRVDWLETRRQEAHEGMRRRRRDGYGGGSNWSPTLFRAR
ncbi:MAG: YkvA family protein [Dokdonella sp.]|uniref:YkvA family protein n=1 Tax=Dokdonella sp. TaxID=2291710 RepID=UPI002B9391B8|nr:YkvA family protein [Dokdonella sp.]HOX72854.1 YkvA family protein [Dokdonella sp.]HPG93752.1 YkvA family protein [Dokdonella sp.]HPN79398.1 YkvA family protein [Dokdonella sp.]